MFWEKLGRWGQRKALCCGDEHVTYEQLDHLCTTFLKELPDSKCLLLIEADNSIESIVALYGALRKGHAVCLCEQGNSRLKQNLSSCFQPELVYEKRDGGWRLRENSQERKTYVHEELALLLTTSGSTGQPRCARLTGENLAANTDAITAYLPITGEDRCLLTLPVFYCYGLSVLNTHMSKGATVHLHGPGAEDEGFVRYLSENKITSFSGVPYTFELLERTGFRENTLPQLRYMTQAGGRLRKELVVKYEQWARRNGSSFYVMYGQAEAAPRMSYVPPELLAENPDCIGIPIPGGQLSVEDNFGNVITEAGVEGELVYRGPNVMLGYADGLEDLGRGREIDRLKTGDLGMLNERNLYKVTGRKKRLCKIYGRSYNLDDIESFLQEHDSSAVCFSDDTTLFIASEQKEPIKLAAKASAQFNIAQVNIVASHYPEIPVLASGKTDYRKIARDFSRGAGERERGGGGNTLEQLLNIYREAFPEDAVSEKDSFAGLGGDSLNYVAVSIDIEKVLGGLPDRWEKRTIEELAGLAVKNETSRNSVETGVFLRAVAILAVVMQHNDLFLGGGALILLLVAGFNFSRFHLDRLIAGNVRPVFSSLLWNILLPYWIVLCGYNLFSYKSGGEIPVIAAKFLLIGNYYYQVDWYPFPTWFVQVLFQTIAVVALPLCIPPLRRHICRNIFRYLLFLLAAGILYRIVDAQLLMQLFPNRFADQRTAWEAWIFIFGLLLFRIDSVQGRKTASIVLVILTVIFWHGFWSRVVALSLGGLLLMWKRQMAVPRSLVPAVKLLGSASLFIYMTHLIGITAFVEPYGQVAQVVAGLVQGILMWFVYTGLKARIVAFSANHAVLDRNL